MKFDSLTDLMMLISNMKSNFRNFDNKYLFLGLLVQTLKNAFFSMQIGTYKFDDAEFKYEL